MKKKESYYELLKDPQWIKRRNEILTRDKNTCQFCGAQDRYLHVHHKRYENGKKPWEYLDEDLVCICEKCHQAITNDSRELYDIFLYARDEFREYGFSDTVLKAILERLGLYFESTRTAEHECNGLIDGLLEDAVLGTQFYDDFKTLAKLGIKHQDFINYKYPAFSEQYSHIETDKRIIQSTNEQLEHEKL